MATNANGPYREQDAESHALSEWQREWSEHARITRWLALAGIILYGIFVVIVATVAACGNESPPEVAGGAAGAADARRLVREQDDALCDRACATLGGRVASLCEWEADGVRSCSCTCQRVDFRGDLYAQDVEEQR